MRIENDDDTQLYQIMLDEEWTLEDAEYFYNAIFNCIYSSKGKAARS